MTTVIAPVTAQPDEPGLPARFRWAVSDTLTITRRNLMVWMRVPAYLVFTEAGRRGVRRVFASSSFSAVGLAWADRDLSPHYIPVDERHPRLTVDSCMLMASAMVLRLSGRRCCTPRTKKPSCCLTISIDTLRMVLAR